MDTPFTKINFSMFMTYITILACRQHHKNTPPILNYLFNINRMLGAVTFNTSMAIMLPWESTRLLYPNASAHLITKVMDRYNISRPVFEFLNFAAHIFPVTYLIGVRKHWLRHSKDIRPLILSLVIHGGWLKCIPKHYNLNRVYMFNTDVLDDSQWLRLWGVSIIGHCSSYILQNIF
jgi:hypothetical protein